MRMGAEREAPRRARRSRPARAAVLRGAGRRGGSRRNGRAGRRGIEANLTVDTAGELERDLVALAREFAEKQMRPVAAEWDEREAFPWPVFRAACAAGLVGFDLPQAYGGAGIGSLLTACRVQE